MRSDLPEASVSVVQRPENAEAFQILLAFVGMAKGFKLAFAEVNFPPDVDELVAALGQHPDCQDIQFALLRLDDPDLRFLLSVLQEEVAKIQVEPGQKLVLVVRGLEQSIKTVGDYPPVLANLNYARGEYPAKVPHPLLLVLPDYAVTRFAQFAPDFWVWTSATLKFQAAPATIRLVRPRAFVSPDVNSSDPVVERPERIDLLERLREEYADDSELSRQARWEALQQLGLEYQSVRQFTKARDFFLQSLRLSQDLENLPGEANSLYHLGEVLTDSGQFLEARLILQKALVIFKQLEDRHMQAGTYQHLGRVAEELREYEEAQRNYQISLGIYALYGDRYIMQTDVIPGLRRIYQATQDERLLIEVAEILEKSVEEVRSMVNPMLSE